MSRGQDRIRTEFQDGWDSACRLHQLLAEGGDLQYLAEPTVALEPGEYCLAETELEYARWYGLDVQVSYTEPIGRPSLLRPLRLVGDELDRRAGQRDFERARREAERMSQPFWREEQVVVTLLTTTRLICDADGGWWSFWYTEITGQVVTLAEWSFHLNLASTDPIRLRGPDAPAYALAIAWFTYGEESLWQPEFAPLADGAAMPQV